MYGNHCVHLSPSTEKNYRSGYRVAMRHPQAALIFSEIAKGTSCDKISAMLSVSIHPRQLNHAINLHAATRIPPRHLQEDRSTLRLPPHHAGYPGHEEGHQVQSLSSGNCHAHHEHPVNKERQV